MNGPIQTNEYDAMIKKIQHKRRAIIVSTIIALLIIIFAASTIQVEIMDKTIIDYDGMSPVITIMLILVVLVVELFAYVIVSNPLSASMDIECDPQKHLILNSVLNKQTNINDICAVDFFYMGNFDVALDYSNKMIASNKPIMIITGLFNKARCEFFLGDFNSLKETAKQYEIVFHSMNKINQKAKTAYEKIQKILNLLVAISEKDGDKILEYSNIEAWNESKATQGYVYYLKGIAADHLNDKKETIYRLMYVKENCEKMVFAQLAEQYLLNLSEDV